MEPYTGTTVLTFAFQFNNIRVIQLFVCIFQRQPFNRFGIFDRYVQIQYLAIADVSINLQCIAICSM